MMNNNSYCSFLILLFLLPTTINSNSNSNSNTTFTSPTHTLTTDQNALFAFKNAFTLDPEGTLASNWSSNATASVCYWIGVSCGTKHQRVTALNVSGFNLTGALPPHLGNLTFLRYLDISFNNFIGRIPYQLSRLYRLRVLYANNNFFTGYISPWFGDLPNLEILSLSSNNFSGRIPEQIENCSSLQILTLSHNQLTGSIPYRIFNLPSIKVIRISNTELSGRLPNDMCNHLPNLTTLALSYNQLEGQIPPNIWKCTELEMLSLSVNNFNGGIPSEMGNLCMLKELYLGVNNFQGGIPAELGSLSRLEILSMPNATLRGSIPDQLWNCTSLKELYLENNYLSGSLPIKFSLLNLEILHLNGNQLTGEIPSSINNASKLVGLQLYSNSLSGSIPNFGGLRLLQYLLITDNNLSAANRELEFLSSLTSCQFLDTLDVSGNPLNGILPTSVGNLSKTLQEFSAYNCNIKGFIPSSFGNLTGMQRIVLIDNKLKGFIPPTIGKLNQLGFLGLSTNRLQGHIPLDLCHLTNIYELYLDENVLTGPIPECLGEMDSLRDIRIGSNELNSTIPSNFWNLKDLVFLNLSSNYFSGQLPSQIGSFKAINQLDMSRNQFSGNIPSSIDGCQVLQLLSLSNNKFEGSIPSSLGNMRGLNTLDLSNNNLSGLIPKSLESLKDLQSFNVSGNKLEGEIPAGGPFVNFTAQSFLNNSALCGATMFQVPACHAKDNRTSRLKKVCKLIKYIVPPFVLVIFVATIVILVLISKQRRKLKRVQVPMDDISPGGTLRRVSYAELVRGTNAFSETNLLGRGSFGSVFKATLSDGLNVAVKVFNLQLERAIQSFNTECEILSSIRHRNLVPIIGCCSNMEFKALILGYMPNGSLEEWLHSDNCCLSLIQRVQIAIDVALALEYLHHGHTFPVVHCDIKPSNVLLDDDMVAHLGDFGISKFFDDGETVVHTKTLATIGYAAPEYGSEGKVSTNGDVYSYGILLLEMFTRKRPTDDMFSDEMSLKEWVYRALIENAASEVVIPDQHLSAKEEECVSSIFSLAMKCLAVSPDERINMIETVGTLQKIKAKVVTVATRHRQHGNSIAACVTIE